MTERELNRNAARRLAIISRDALCVQHSHGVVWWLLAQFWPPDEGWLRS